MFKKQLKVISAALVIVMLCSAVLVGCGNEGVVRAPSSSPTEGEDVPVDEGENTNGELDDTEEKETPLMEKLDILMQDMFGSTYMYNETVMFIDYGDTKPLLFPATEILSVRSYDGKIIYKEGEDYELVDGKIKLLEGSAIPCITSQNYYNVAGSILQMEINGNITDIYWGEGDSMTKYQVNVEYNHDYKWLEAGGFIQQNYSERFVRLLTKMEKGEDVTIIFYGDSITVGANASEYIGHDPYQLPYAKLVVDSLARLYGYNVIEAGVKISKVTNFYETVLTNMQYGEGENAPTITYINRAVGGTTSEWGATEFDNTKLMKESPLLDQFIRDKEYGCDLMVIAFGANDGGEPSETAQNYEAIINKTLALAPECEFLLVSTMTPNPDAIGWVGRKCEQEAYIMELPDKLGNLGIHCAVAQMTSMSLSVLEHKEFLDYTGNNINHPNDFFSRVYAQTLLEALIGYENLR